MEALIVNLGIILFMWLFAFICSTVVSTISYIVFGQIFMYIRDGRIMIFSDMVDSLNYLYKTSTGITFGLEWIFLFPIIAFSPSSYVFGTLIRVYYENWSWLKAIIRYRNQLNIVRKYCKHWE